MKEVVIKIIKLEKNFAQIETEELSLRDIIYLDGEFSDIIENLKLYREQIIHKRFNELENN